MLENTLMKNVKTKKPNKSININLYTVDRLWRNGRESLKIEQAASCLCLDVNYSDMISGEKMKSTIRDALGPWWL